VELTFTLSQTLFSELVDACKESQCSPRQFAGECVEAILAERRLPRVEIGSHGAWTSGTRGTRSTAVEEQEEAEPEGYSVRLPDGMEPLT
jgi:hypothetical protein